MRQKAHLKHPSKPKYSTYANMFPVLVFLPLLTLRSIMSLCPKLYALFRSMQIQKRCLSKIGHVRFSNNGGRPTLEVREEMLLGVAVCAWYVSG